MPFECLGGSQTSRLKLFGLHVQQMGCGASSKVSEAEVHVFVDVTNLTHRNRMYRNTKGKRSVNGLSMPQTVDGSDTLDLEAMDDLIEPLNSFTMQTFQPKPPSGIRVPLPPNRRMHEKHMRKMNSFLEETNADTLFSAVDLKRDIAALRHVLHEPEELKHQQC